MLFITAMKRGGNTFLCDGCLNLFRFCEGNFVGEMESTIGVDFYLSEIDVDGKKIKVSKQSQLYYSTLLRMCTIILLLFVYKGKDLGHGWVREVHVNISSLLSKGRWSHFSV